MSPVLVWTVILGMAATNLVLRLVPLAAVSRLRLPDPVERWLSFVPVSVMAALVTVAVLRPEEAWLAPQSNPYLLAALPTALTYRLTRSFIGATLAGIVFFLAARWLMGLG